MKLVFFVRHVDTDKNVLSRFSSSSLGESITEHGLVQLRELVEGFRSFEDDAGVVFSKIYFSPSDRARRTAELLASKLSISPIELPNFDSIDAGPFSGLTENQVQEVAPDFLRELALYRAGLLSSYSIGLPSSAEALHDFEARIVKTLDDIVDDSECEAAIVVSHRSPITASLIHFARQAHAYPHDFYGYVDLSTGGTSVVETVEGVPRILAVNISPVRLHSSVAEIFD